MAAHIAQDALAHKLHEGACKACDMGAVRRNLVACRHSASLNGPEAAHEFSRALLPAVRSRLIARDTDGRAVL